MPIPSPFHDRTSKLCHSMSWKDWAGYYAVTSFEHCHEAGYMAIRHAAGLQDVTPLYKYEVYGPGATAFLARIMTKDVAKLKLGQVTYCCWCDEFGKVIDDGTVSRLEEDYYRVTAAEPTLWWFERFARGYDVTIEDSTTRFGVLSLQGPNSRAILEQVTDVDMDKLRFFRVKKGQVAGVDGFVSRTGYSGDLGFEVWVEAKDALPLWDALMAEGKAYGIKPNGLAALDVTRIEAGFIMNGVDYFSAHQCLIEARKSSPYELGLGWTVNLDRGAFNGQAALRREKAEGSPWSLAGIEIDWVDLEDRFAAHGLPPELPHGVWRSPACIYSPDGQLVGRATSGSFSPILKKNLALATLETPWARPGTELRIEWMVEFRRERTLATVRQPPFFDPPRKKSTPGIKKKKKNAAAKKEAKA